MINFTRRSTAAAVISAVAVSAMLASGCSSSVASNSTDQVAPSDWTATSLPAIPIDKIGAGAQQPIYPNSVVTDQQGLAVSVRPTLQATSAPPNQQYEFSISTADGLQSKTVWHQAAGNNQVKVVPVPGEPEVLTQGNQYLWQAVGVVDKKTYGPYVMNVDTMRAGLQPSQAFGPFGVDLASGSLSYAPGLRSIRGASGALAVNLAYAPAANSTPGVPAGWMLTGSSQGWSHVQVNPEDPSGPVALVSVTGSVVEYAPNAGGTSYTAVAPPGRPAPTGSDATLVKNSDNTWTATMPSGQVSLFAATDSDGVGYLTQTYNGITTLPDYQLDNGKIVSITDPVAHDPDFAVTLTYDDTGHCPAADTANGFVATTTGLLCQISYPDKSTTQFEYQDGTNGPLLARIIDYPGTKDSKPDVTDIGYDLADRIVALREPAAANGQAAGVRTDAAALLDTVQYDSQGRVQKIIKPAAEAGQNQPSYTIDYGSSSSNVTTIYAAAGQPTTMGWSSKISYDANTLLQQTSTDSQGKTVTTTWNTAQDQRLQDTDADGRTVQYQYDAQGNPTKQLGPFKRSSDSNTPWTQYTYDQDTSDGATTDLQGFNVTYWDNSSLTGVPAGRTFGPMLDNGHTPQSANLLWEQSPANGSFPWGARLTGIITVPSLPSTHYRGHKNTSTPSQYGFRINKGSAQLWIDGVACGTQCQLPLTVGSHQIRIDLGVAQQQDGAAGALDVQWQLPGDGFSEIPMSAIAPGYGLVSTTSKNDQLSATTDPITTEHFRDYADPATSNITSSWANLSPSATLGGTASYEPFDMNNDQYGRITSSALPSGNQTTFSYYGPDDQPDMPCGLDSASQHGLPKLVTRNGQQYQSYFDNDGRMVAASIDGTATYCAFYNDGGELEQEIIPARGDQPQTTLSYQQFVNGDPFAASMTVAKGDQTYTTSTHTNLYGQVISSMDVWGTSQTFTYDPYSGRQTSVTTTLAGGKSSTTTTTYTKDGDPWSVTVDGQTLATLSEPTSTGSTVSYGNGVSQSVTFNDAGSLTSQNWNTAGEKSEQLSYTVKSSPAMRVLSETYGMGNNIAGATFQYSYDPAGRLIGAQLATTLPTAHHSWQYSLDADSNRTQQIVDAQQIKGKLVGGQQTDYTYNANDQLQSTTDPAMPGQVGYSGWGEIQQLGSLTFDYDGTSFATQVTNQSNGQQIRYNRLGSMLIEKTTTGNGTTSDVRYTAGGYVLDGNNNPQWRILNLPGGTTLIEDMANNQQWQHSTARGQYLWSSDNNGQDTGTRQLYSPFGEQLLDSSAVLSHKTTAAEVAAPNYQWQAGNSLETDQLGGISLIDMGARLYIPALGRFISPDPQVGGSANAYDYANQDPINQSDPSGAMAGWLKFLLNAALVVAGCVIAGVLTGGLGIFAEESINVALVQTGVSATGDNFAGAAATFQLMGGLAGSAVGKHLFYPNSTPWYVTATDCVITLAAATVAYKLAQGFITGIKEAAAVSREGWLANQAAERAAAQATAGTAREAAANQAAGTARTAAADNGAGTGLSAAPPRAQVATGPSTNTAATTAAGRQVVPGQIADLSDLVDRTMAAERRAYAISQGWISQ